MSKSERGMGRVFKATYPDLKNGGRRESDTWSIRYSFRGKVYQESSGSRNRADAVRLLKKRQGEMGTGRFLGPDAEKTTVDELLGMHQTDYRINGLKSLDRIEDAHNHLLGSFAGMRAIDVTGDKIALYVQERQAAKGAANNTINKELGALKRAFTLGFRAGKVAQRPYIPMLKETQPRQGFFTEADCQRLLGELRPYLQPLIECYFLTGWRQQELLRLKWSDVDFRAGTIRLDTSKNGDARVYPFSVWLRLETLLRQQRERTTALEREQGSIIPYVFHRAGKPIKNFRSAWDGAVKRTGLPHKVPHDLRRSAIRNMEHAGVPRSVAMKLVGHKTESVYTRYAVMFEDDLRRGVEKLAILDAAPEGGKSGTVSPLKPSRTGRVPGESRGQAVRQQRGGRAK